MESIEFADVGNGIDHVFMARFEAVSLGVEDDGALRLLVRDTSEKMREKLELVLGGRKVILEALSKHPELQDKFEETVGRCKKIAEREPSSSTASIEAYLSTIRREDQIARATFLN